MQVACETLKAVPTLVLYPLFSAFWAILFLASCPSRSVRSMSCRCPAASGSALTTSLELMSADDSFSACAHSRHTADAIAHLAARTPNAAAATKPSLPRSFDVQVWWVAVLLFIYSSGEIVKRNCCGEVQAEFQSLYPGLPAAVVPSCGEINCGYTVVVNKPLRNTLIYHGFEFLWTTQYIQAFGMLVIAQVAYYYYNHAGSGADMPLLPVLRAMKNAAWYYPGCIALGSFMVASVQAARLALAYIGARHPPCRPRLRLGLSGG